MINKYLSQISKSIRNNQRNNFLTKKSISLPRLIQNTNKPKDSQNLKDITKRKISDQKYISNKQTPLQVFINKQKESKKYKSKEKQQNHEKNNKINRYVSLEKINTEGKFVSKNQYSIDTSVQQNEQVNKISKELNYKFEVQNVRTIRKNKELVRQNENNQKDIFKKRMSEIVDNKLLPKNKQITNKNNEKIGLIKQMDNSNKIKQQSISSITFISQNNQKHIKDKLVGEEAIERFYEKYKNIQKVRELQLMNNEVSSLTLILTILQSYNIPPKKMEFIKKSGQESILNLSHLSLGSSVSLNAISDILAKLDGFQSIDLSYNNIVLDLVDIIIPQLTTMSYIDFSHNRIGKRGADLLSLMCKGTFKKNIQKKQDKTQDQSNCLLQYLSLQENCLSDYSLHNLIDSFISYKQLRILDLSKNYLGNHFANKLKQYLIQDNCLDQLYLRWNDITSKGAKNIFEGLIQNTNLKVFDFSWNHISFQTIPAICSFFKKNKSLIHLDISFCDVTEKDTIQLAESLKFNHTIYGIHYDGNQGKIDSLGYLTIDNKQKNNDNISLLRRGISEKINSVYRKSHFYQKYNAFKSYKACWICDGWEQKYFQIKQQQHQQACFIHFDFEQYKGITMRCVQKKFILTKMLPKRQINFFITKVDDKKKFIHQSTILQNRDTQIRQQILQEEKALPTFLISNKQFKNIKIKSINKIKMVFSSQIFDEDYQPTIQSKPRFQGLKPNSKLFQIDPVKTITLPQKKKKKIKVKKQRNKQNDKKARQLLHIQNYFIGQDSQMSSQLHKKCVDFDFQHSKVHKIINEPKTISILKTILYQNYLVFKNVYYYLCNNNPSISGIFNISETRFQHFIEEQHYQTAYYTKAKIRLKLISCLTSLEQQTKEKQEGQQHKLFSRPQFFEFLLRIAIDKYCKKRKIVNENGESQQNKTLSVQEAFTKILTKLKRFQDKIILPNCWREQFLYSYDISLVIKSYENFIQTIYNQYAGSQQKNMNSKTNKKILLNQFKQIFLQAQIRKTKQALKDAQICFIQSKNLQVQDGIQQYGLSYTQYLQAFIRMAHGLNLKPVNTQNQKIWQKIQQMQNHKQIKHSQEVYYQIPLFLKVQSLITKIYFARKTHRTKRLDKIFSKGLFAQQIQMLIQILKQRVEIVHEKYRPIMYQKAHKIKLNSLGSLDLQFQGTNNNQHIPFKKINLQYLVEQLKEKYKRMADQLDKNYNQYDEISVKQDDEQNIQMEDIP